MLTFLLLKVNTHLPQCRFKNYLIWGGGAIEVDVEVDTLLVHNPTVPLPLEISEEQL